MLKKLIAHDFRCTWKITTLLYVTSVIAAVLSVVCDAIYVNLPMGEEVSTITILLTSGLSMASGLLTMLAFFCVCAVFLVSAVHYYKKMVSDEAYLTFTLPATPGQHLLAKLVMGVVWTLVGVFVVIFNTVVVSIIEVLFVPIDEELLEEEAEMVITAADAHIFLAVVILILVLLVVQFTLIYLALTIGGVIANKHKAVAGVALYWFSNSIVMGVMVFAAIIVSAIIAQFIPMTEDWESAFILYLCSPIVAAFGVLFFFINRYLLTKKLNLP